MPARQKRKVTHNDTDSQLRPTSRTTTPGQKHAKRQKLSDGEHDRDDVIVDVPVAAISTAVSEPISLASFASGVTTTTADTQNTPSSVMTTQSLTSIKRPGKNPGAYFNKPLPPLQTPWPLNFARPHGSYDQDTASPINWSAFPELELIDQRVYDCRAPWNPNPRPMTEVAKEYQKVANETKVYSQEGMRKRFRLANQAIFKATGVYFIGSGLGLVEHGIPNDSEIPRLMREIAHTQPSARSVKVKRPSGKTKLSHKDELPSNEKRSKDDWNYELDTVTLLLQLPGGSGYATRHITREIWQSLRITGDERISCTTAIFDRWYSCVCFGLRYTLPKRVHKLKKLPGGCVYVDEGIPSTNIHTLLDTYCLSQTMGTTAVSDMLLNEINRSLKNEKIFYDRFGGLGSLCQEDCNYIVRLLDLEPADIRRLWERTTTDDPIRSLLIDLFTYHSEEIERSAEKVEYGLRSASRAAQLYSIFAQDHRREAIQSFLDADYPELFCAKYHNHGNDKACSLSISSASLGLKIIKDVLDTLDTSSMYQLNTDIVKGCKIINKAGGGLDITALYNQKRGWDWERIKSINSWVYIPCRGRQIRTPHPVYFMESEKDLNGRYPCHPGFGDPKWVPFDEDDGYKKEDWNKARHFGVPDDAQRVREDEETGELLFEIEDTQWIPPSWFVPEVNRRKDQSYKEYQDYRRWLWTERGNKIPLMTCKRWRPFNERQTNWEDPFKDTVKPR